MDILLDENSWDIAWFNGPLSKEYTTQPLTQTVAQRLKIRLLTHLNEYFWDTTYGVPYFQRILGVKQKSKAAVDLIFNQKILEEPGVKEITYFSSTFVNRVYTLTFQVKVVDNSVTENITITI